MRRREFITLLGGAAAAWPLAARAQQAERDPARRRADGLCRRFAITCPHGGIPDELQKLGWTEDRNIRIDTRWAAFDAK